MGNCSAWRAYQKGHLRIGSGLPVLGLWSWAGAIPYFPDVGAAIISIKRVFSGTQF
jgi:hypothetical protein